MASLEDRQNIFMLASSLRMRLAHFSAGVYPTYTAHAAMYPVNRFFLVEDSPDGEKNYIEDAGSRCILQTGEAYLVPAFYPTCWRLSAKLRFISIHFSLETLEGIDIFSMTKRIFHCSGGNYLPAAQEAWQGKESYQAAVLLKALCYRLCSELLSEFSSADFETVNRFALYRQVLDFIREKGNAKTSVAELAELMGMRQDTFSKKFTKDTGIAPKIFLNNFLIRQAGELLLRQHNVRETAELLGFNNEYYFSAFFKRLTGFSPSDYRKHFTVIPQ